MMRAIISLSLVVCGAREQLLFSPLKVSSAREHIFSLRDQCDISDYITPYDYYRTLKIN